MATPNPEFAVKSGLALIIPTRNRPDLLRRLLANLEEVSLKPGIEVLERGKEMMRSKRMFRGGRSLGIGYMTRTKLVAVRPRRRLNYSRKES